MSVLWGSAAAELREDRRGQDHFVGIQGDHDNNNN